LSSVDSDLERSVKFEGQDLLTSGEDGIGVIFQDPLSALNPVRKVGRQIAEVAEEPLKLTPRAAEHRAGELLSLVGLPDPLSRLGRATIEAEFVGIAENRLIAVRRCPHQGCDPASADFDQPSGHPTVGDERSMPPQYLVSKLEHDRKKTGGHAKSTPNRTTSLLKNTILGAVELAGAKPDDDSAGGLVAYLQAQAKENPDPLLTSLGNVLPMQGRPEGLARQHTLVHGTVRPANHVSH